MIERMDHIVMTVGDLKTSVSFYTRALQRRKHCFDNGRQPLRFGGQKINLQVTGQEPRNKAVAGSGDMCHITDRTLDHLHDHLPTKCADVLEGPVVKCGTAAPIVANYFNDPDKNLIEVSSYERNAA